MLRFPTQSSVDPKARGHFPRVLGKQGGDAVANIRHQGALEPFVQAVRLASHQTPVAGADIDVGFILGPDLDRVDCAQHGDTGPNRGPSLEVVAVAEDAARGNIGRVVLDSDVGPEVGRARPRVELVLAPQPRHGKMELGATSDLVPEGQPNGLGTSARLR